MTDLKIFENDSFGQVRVIMQSDGNPVFCLIDVCKVLELDASQVARRLDDGVFSIHPTHDALGRVQNTNFVNEDGLYDVIFDSRKPEARQFRKWVTSEVLPSIRKHGIYVTDNVLDNLIEHPEAAIRFLTEIKEERNKRKIAEEKAQRAIEQNVYLEQRVNEMQPKEEYYDAVMASRGISYSLQEAPKMLQLPFGRTKFVAMLREQGILLKYGKPVPKQQYLNEGYFVLEAKDRLEHGKLISYHVTKVTPKGLEFCLHQYKKFIH